MKITKSFVFNIRKENEMNKLSAYLLGLILGGSLMTSVFIGHYDNWQSFGPVLGVMLSGIGVILFTVTCSDADEDV